MQRNRALLREIQNTNQPSFSPTPLLRAHKGIAQVFKLKADNDTKFTISDAINSMRDTLYNSIPNNRNNTTQKIQIGVAECFSKPEEVLNNRDLVDSVTGIIHKKGTVYIPTNREVEDDKYHQSDVLTLYSRSSIRKILDDLNTSLIQKREDNMARLEGANNHKWKYIKETFVRFHELNPPSARSFVLTPKKLAGKKGYNKSKNVSF